MVGRWSLELFPGDNWLLFQNEFIFGLMRTFLNHKLLCAFEVLVFGEIGCFGQFSAFGWVFFRNIWSLAFPISFINFINFVLEEGHILDIDIDLNSLWLVKGEFSFDVFLKIFLINLGTILLGFNQICVPFGGVFFQISEVKGFDVDLSLWLLYKLWSSFLFGFGLDGGNDFFRLFFLGNFWHFPISGWDELGVEGVILYDSIDANIFSFEFFLEVHFKFEYMSV